MASICTSNFHFLCRKNNSSPISHHLLLSPSSLSFSRCGGLRLCRCAAVKTGSEGGGIRSDNAELLRKPVISTELETTSESEELVKEESDDEVGKKSGDGEGWVDWEDQILEDTVPLVGFVRMILHSGKYAIGDRLSPDHQRTILQRLLPYHPECDKKIGPGVDYITVGYHPDFENSRCLFIVRKDGETVDFSYWKCIKGLIRKNYPLYADSFILRHFRKRRRND
ncbi:protein DCL, chloroplastic [Solanum lycopersicum]|uniref:Protein DCL, chloroplastic n=1 Tax=Solanum lycopersicum TaxID=4081 RepID=DCL_SOLLC|nr:protein DCL, chloroplastic [Solanum lycopersicum]Q42463.1 RecName: Full=Protein DCL, chloroplastic; AltName: Full=Defective chloroplasts and leaves protein; Flags: Precursor [Solanum lycopersicum]AAC49433.1 defective chloroplasts and leaves; required for chloroplast development and palisade cell differentiation in leaves [Solanum lycopersicum]AAC49434.1 DCL [Solanum lycopersicum]